MPRHRVDQPAVSTRGDRVEPVGISVVVLGLALLTVSVWRYRTIRARQVSVLRAHHGRRVRIGMERFVGQSMKEPYEITCTVVAVDPSTLRVEDAASSQLSSEQRSNVERQGLPLGELIWVEDAAGERTEFGRGLVRRFRPGTDSSSGS